MAEIGTDGNGIVNICTNDAIAKSDILDFLKIFRKEHESIKINIFINNTDNLIQIARAAPLLMVKKELER